MTASGRGRAFGESGGKGMSEWSHTTNRIGGGIGIGEGYGFAMGMGRGNGYGFNRGKGGSGFKVIISK